MVTAIEIACYEVALRLSQARLLGRRKATKSKLVLALNRLTRSVAILTRQADFLSELPVAQQLISDAYKFVVDEPMYEDTFTLDSNAYEVFGEQLLSAESLLNSGLKTHSTRDLRLEVWFQLGLEIPLGHGCDDFVPPGQTPDPPWTWQDEERVRQLIADAGTAMDVVFPDRPENDPAWKFAREVPEDVSQWARIEAGLTGLKATRSIPLSWGENAAAIAPSVEKTSASAEFETTKKPTEAGPAVAAATPGRQNAMVPSAPGTDRAIPIKRPADRDFMVWRLRDATGANQSKLGEIMTEQGYPMRQGQVSKALKKVEAYLADGNVLPPIEPLKTKPQSVDPDILEMGSRRDGLTPRQRDRRDPDSDDE